MYGFYNYLFKYWKDEPSFCISESDEDIINDLESGNGSDDGSEDGDEGKKYVKLVNILLSAAPTALRSRINFETFFCKLE